MLVGPLAEDLGRQHVELRRLVDRLDRVAAEQLIAPGDQVVEYFITTVFW